MLAGNKVNQTMLVKGPQMTNKSGKHGMFCLNATYVAIDYVK